MRAGTLVTVAGFLPVGLAKSLAGEEARGIVQGVAIALITPWFVAVIVTPCLGVLPLPEHVRRG